MFNLSDVQSPYGHHGYYQHPLYVPVQLVKQDVHIHNNSQTNNFYGDTRELVEEEIVELPGEFIDISGNVHYIQKDRNRPDLFSSFFFSDYLPSFFYNHNDENVVRWKNGDEYSYEVISPEKLLGLDLVLYLLHFFHLRLSSFALFSMLTMGARLAV